MYEIILTACVFANAYSTELVCEEQRMTELPSCAAVAISQIEGVMIKGVECRKMIPVAPPPKVGEKSA